jgi:transcriptional regulator with XRE-family HTH domain
VTRSSAPKSVADFIRRAMLAQGLSQLEVARRAGVSQSTVARVIRGAVSVTTDTLEPIASALGTSVTDIISHVPTVDVRLSARTSKRTESERLAHLAKMYAACDKDAQELLLALAEKLARRKGT